jgi:hypothetical protein
MSSLGQCVQHQSEGGAGYWEMVGNITPNLVANGTTFGIYGTTMGWIHYAETGDPTSMQQAAAGQAFAAFTLYAGEINGTITSPNLGGPTHRQLVFGTAGGHPRSCRERHRRRPARTRRSSPASSTRRATRRASSRRRSVRRRAPCGPTRASRTSRRVTRRPSPARTSSSSAASTRPARSSLPECAPPENVEVDEPWNMTACGTVSVLLPLPVSRLPLAA